MRRGGLSEPRGLILTRRISGADGSFQGVIGAAVPLDQFDSLYQQLDLGAQGLASLWGTDGVVRVAGGNGGLRPELIGKKFVKAGVFEQLRKSRAGTYWNAPTTPAAVARLDQVERLVTYRTMDEFPLVIVVGRSELEVFRDADGNAVIYWSITALCTIGIVIAIGLGARRERRLNLTTASLAQANARFEAAIENMAHGMSMVDADLRITVANSRYATMYGLDRQQIKPGTWLGSVFKARMATADPDEANAYVERLLAVARGREPNQVVTRLPDDRVIAISHQPTADGGAVAVHQDITVQKRAEAMIWHLAHHDSLTGLANRHVFVDELQKAAQKCREQSECFAVFMLDIDRFKEINNSLGHPTGDALLKEVARRLQPLGGAKVARLGGDEFAILQPLDGVPDETAMALAAKYLSIIEGAFDIDANHLFVEASIGIALAPDHGLDASDLMKKADLALYRAKAEGRKGCKSLNRRWRRRRCTVMRCCLNCARRWRGASSKFTIRRSSMRLGSKLSAPRLCCGGAIRNAA